MTLNPGDIITVDFPGVTGIKRRPAVVLSSDTYHANRPDVIIGLITTQTTGLGVTDYVLQDWQSEGLRVASVFRSFLVTLPRSANLVCIGQLSERDWQGVRQCVKIALAELDNLNKSFAQSSSIICDLDGVSKSQDLCYKFTWYGKKPKLGDTTFF